MEFLSPWFWTGALAVTVPVLLHLVQKEKTRRILFSSLMFVPRLPLKQMRRRKLKHLFLLLLRCMALLLLVTAFARPVVTGDWFGGLHSLSSRAVLILVDRSLSMSRPQVWDQAMEAARGRIERLGDSDEASIVVFAEGAQVVAPWDQSKPVLLEALQTAVEPSFEATSYLEGLRMAVDQFNDQDQPNREIFLITDLQRSGLSSTQGWKIPAEIRFELFDAGASAWNVHVAEARVERDVYGKEYDQPILVRLSAQPPRATQGTAELVVGGNVMARQEFQLGEEGTGQLTFQPFELKEGISRGQVVLDPGDELEADDIFHFVLERREPTRILLISGGRSDAVYLEKALSAGSNRPFQIQTLDRLGAAALDPEDTSLIVLHDVDRLPPAAVMDSYLKGGGGIVVALGRNTRKESFGSGWEELLPVRLEEKRYVRSRTKPFTSLTDVTWQHPIFQVFQDTHRAAVVSTQFYAYWKVTPSPQASVLASYGEGDPALVQATHGNGKILVLTTSPDPLWGDFPLRSAFVPFWHQAVRFVANWQPEPAARRVNEILNRPGSPSNQSQGAWTVLDPTGTRVTSLDDTAPDSIQLKTPGFYEIRENKGTNWVAVNALPVESDLTRIPAEDVLAVFVPQQSRTGASLTGQESSTFDREKQQSLWWLFLVAAAAVILLEALVANSRRLQEPT